MGSWKCCQTLVPVYHQTKDRLKSYVLAVKKREEALWRGVGAESVPYAQVSLITGVHKSCYSPTAWQAVGGCCGTWFAWQKADEQIKPVPLLVLNLCLGAPSPAGGMLVSVWFSVTGACWESCLISCLDLFSISL